MVAPAIALAVLIIVPLLTMPGSQMEIKGANAGTMTPLLMMVMAMANGLIAVSYASIPVFLIIFIRKRKDIPFSWVLVMFGAFILACGTTHVVHIVGLWRQVDWWQAVVDTLCAIISMTTAVLVWPLLPKMLAIPSPTQLRAVNRELQDEKASLEHTQGELRKACAEVEQRVQERTADLARANASLLAEINVRQEAAAALLASEAQFREYAEAAPQLTWICRPDGWNIYFNQRWADYTGLSLAESYGHGWNKPFHPDDQQRAWDAWKRATETDAEYDVEFRLRRADGVYRWFVIRGRPLRDAAGCIVRWFGTCTDIDDRKAAEEKIHLLNAELEQRVRDRTAELAAANKELEAFSYSVSHDLRAPLRGIDGWSLALLEDYHDRLDERGRQYLDRVRSETQRMGQLIEDLHQLSRVSRAELLRSTVDLSAVAHSIAARLQEAQSDRQVEFIIQPGLAVAADPALLEVILTNLLSNAWKFTGRRARARIEFGVHEGEAAIPVFYVRDNGAGFDMAYADNLFGAFQRMHQASEFPGTGIGLATVQRIVHRHGGRVWAESVLERGTTFFFTLQQQQP